MSEPSQEMLAQLRRFRRELEAAAAESGFDLGDPLTAEEIAAREADLGGPFPDEYRWFLKEVAGHFETDCAFHLFRPEDAMLHILDPRSAFPAYAENAPAGLDMRQFGFTAEQAHGAIRRLVDRARERARSHPGFPPEAEWNTLAHARFFDDGDGLEGNDWNTGTLFLCDAGCGWEHYLVVFGPQSGTVWQSSERGWFPEFYMRDGAPAQHDFLTWFDTAFHGPW
jgi:hypothetical protein